MKTAFFLVLVQICSSARAADDKNPMQAKPFKVTTSDQFPPADFGKNGLIVLPTVNLDWDEKTKEFREVQVVEYRFDYNTARLESAQKKAPLLLIISQPGELRTVRLLNETMRAPAIVKLCREDIVPLLIDAKKEARLAEALRVTSYPTILIASPDGKIVDRMLGFTDASRLERGMRALGTRTPTGVTPTVKDAGVTWRTDFASARKEASDKNRHLLLLVGDPGEGATANMRRELFARQSIVTLCRERVIPLFVDARKDAALANAVGTGSPSIVVATPGGRILGTLVGYHDADRLESHVLLLLHSKQQ